jgi:hypothetical protein
MILRDPQHESVKTTNAEINAAPLLVREVVVLFLL